MSYFFSIQWILFIPFTKKPSHCLVCEHEKVENLRRENNNAQMPNSNVFREAQIHIVTAQIYLNL